MKDKHRNLYANYKQLKEKNVKLQKKNDDLRKGFIDSETMSMFIQKGMDSATEVECKNLISKCSQLDEENQQLKDLLKECKQRFETYKRIKPCGEYMIYDLEYLTTKIDEVLK